MNQERGQPLRDTAITLVQPDLQPNFIAPLIKIYPYKFKRSPALFLFVKAVLLK